MMKKLHEELLNKSNSPAIVMQYAEFKEKCLAKSISFLPCADTGELSAFIEHPDNSVLLEEYYNIGVARYVLAGKHDNGLAFDYCITTVAENISLLF